jgi:CNT family concentrative nucleoside transporter
MMLDEVSRLLAILGIFTFLSIAYAASANRKAIRWKTVGWGLGLQLLFAILVLKWSVGQRLLSLIAAGVTRVVTYADGGGSFVFGWLASNPDPEKSVFAFKVLPIVIFISSLSACLYYLGIMQWVVVGMARIMTRIMGVSGAESLSAAANVFMGQTEAPIVIAPYIPQMTVSELMAVMTGGMATVSGAVLGGYIAIGINPEYLITASIMAAPASLVMAKILVPETESPKTAGTAKLKVERTEANLIDAAARGAGRGVKLAINIAAMLIAFISIIYLANGVVGFIGRSSGLETLLGQEITIQLLLGFSMAPIALLMGIPLTDVVSVGQLLGVKIILNEFVAFIDLVEIREGLSAKSELIATYALCGFANLGSIGIQIGGIGGLAPSRRSDLARLGLRALLGGSLASFLTATLVGVLD